MDDRRILIPALAAAAGSALGALAGGDHRWLAAATLAPLLALVAAFVAARPKRAARAVRRSTRSDPSAHKLPIGFGRYLLDQAPVGVLLIDGRCQVQLMNPRAERFLGRAPARPFHMSALRTPRFLEAIDAALRTGAASETEASTLTGGQTLHLHASIQPLSADAAAAGQLVPPAVMVVLEDRTRVRRTEETHRDFVANASHELKTPLASISGIVETLAGHARNDPDATARFLRIMAAEIDRMKRLVTDLLSLNRIELNERIRPERPQSIRRIVAEAAETFRPRAEALGVTLTVEPAADLPLVAGDEGELTQLVSNLVDNALKYGGAGGRVDVGSVERDGRIGIVVRDDGPGIAREHLPRLTERFYRVSVASSREKGGTGLGLAIVKHVVSRHQGELQIESSPGKGATFTVWLPFTNRRDSAATGRSAA